MAEQDAPQTSTALAEHRPQILGPPPVLTPLAPIMSDDEIQRTFRIASALAQSGMFKDVTQAEQAFGRILLGRDLGLSPTQALMGLDVVKGNVQMRGVLLLSFVRKSADYDYAVAEHTSEAATIEIRRRVDGEWQSEGTERFTIEDAKRAKIYKEGGAWEAHPGNMCLWRAASNAVKFYAPDLLGGIPVYTEADTVVSVPNLAEGQGDGAEPGWGTVPIAAVHEVEKIIRRAEKLGHAGLASRSAAQMLLNGQSDDVVRKWITDASAELDNVQAKAQVERGDKPAPEPDPESPERGWDASLNHEPAEHPEEGGTPQPEGVNDDGSLIADADPVLEPDGSTSWREAHAHLPESVQLELAEARLAGALNEAEEREARAEVERLRGEG